MSDLFETIFNDFSLFGKPYVVFNTNGIRDLMPTFWKPTKEGYRCTAKTLGISESDIQITTEDYGIKLYGKSTLDGEDWDTTLKLPISNQVLNNLEEIRTKTVNGLTFIDLIVTRIKQKKVLINGK
jgi:HSP20 family molecular chaperone IbpA